MDIIHELNINLKSKIMKTKILIKGGIGGNHEIKSKMHRYKGEKKNTFPNEIILFYQSKKDARSDLKDAYKALKEEEPDDDWTTLCENDLHYDASSAILY